MVEIPRLFCERCGRHFFPKMDPETLEIEEQNRCPYRDCRSTTWDVKHKELRERKRKRAENRKMREPKLPKMSITQKPREKRKVEKINYTAACTVCDRLYEDEAALARHKIRRNH